MLMPQILHLLQEFYSDSDHFAVLNIKDIKIYNSCYYHAFQNVNLGHIYWTNSSPFFCAVNVLLTLK